MKATRTEVIDGKLYHAGEEIWDLGSLVCTGTEPGGIRNYEGLAKDIDKLPHYVETGSSCLMLDTGDFYKYEKSTDKWFKL